MSNGYDFTRSHLLPETSQQTVDDHEYLVSSPDGPNFTPMTSVADSNEGLLANLEDGLGEGPWSNEYLDYDAAVREGQTALDTATPWLDAIDTESASARHAYKNWDAEGVDKHGTAAADAAEKAQKGAADAWEDASQAFDADGGTAFDTRRGDLEQDALGLSSDVGSALERAVDRLTIAEASRSASVDGLRTATTMAWATATTVSNALDEFDQDADAALETASTLGTEEAALLKLAVAHSQPALLPALQQVGAVGNDVVDDMEGTKASSNGSYRAGLGGTGFSGSFDARSGGLSTGWTGEKKNGKQDSLSWDGSALGASREWQNGTYGQASMAFDGTELTKLSLGGGREFDGPGGSKMKLGGNLDLFTEDTHDELKEKGTSRSVDGYDASVEAGIGGPLLSVDGMVGHKNVKTIEAKNLRGGGSEYTESRESGWSYGAGVSSAAGGLFFTGSDVDIGGKTIRFENSEAGERARRHYNRYRVLPKTWGGYEVVSSEKGEAKRSGYGFSMFGMGIGNQSELRNTTRKADGKETEHTRSTNQNTTSVPFVGSLVNHTNAIEKMSVVGSDTALWTATTRIDDRSEDAAHAGLSGSDTGNTMRDIDGASSGVWTVQSVMSDEAMHAFLDRTSEQSGVFTPELHEMLQGVTDRDEREAILHEWSRGNSDATQALRREGVTTDFVSLENDRYLTGLQGQMEYEDHILDFRARLKDPTDDKVKLLKDVRSVLDYQQARWSHLEDRKNYPELPGPMRDREIQRARTAVKALTSVRTHAVTIMQVDPDYADDVQLAGSDVSDTNWVTEQKFEAYDKRDEARAMLWRHQGLGLPAKRSDQASAMQKYQDAHRKTYKAAMPEYDRGEGLLETGARSESKLATSIPETPEAATSQRQAADAAAVWYNRAAQAYQRYIEKMESIDEQYDERSPLRNQSSLQGHFAPTDVD